MRTTILLALAALLLTAGITSSGCHQGRARWGSMEASSLPPDLEYIEPGRVRSAMWVIAAEIENLEEQLETAPSASPETRRESIRSTLVRMRAAARSLSEPGRTTQHPVLNQHLPLFIERIDHAIRAVDHDPPSYFRASTLAGSCFLCHGEGVALRKVPNAPGRG